MPPGRSANDASPGPTGSPDTAGTEADGIVVPLRYRYADRVLSFFSTTAVFGTPLDITLAELAIESFFPADRPTAEFLGRWRPA